jgi:nucleotide-binding universal stress UspA family protein
MNSKRLLVATDLSDASDKALECAALFAQKTESEIILLHIFEIADVDDYAKQMMATNFLSRDIKRQLQEQADETAKKFGIKTNYLTKDGELFGLIGEVFIETKSDILFLGTHGVHGVQHLTGSFLAQTINNTVKPVWVVQKQTTIKSYENIFVYVDEFPGQALHPLTLDLAKIYKAHVHFVFTEPNNGYAVTEMVNVVKSTMADEKIEYSLNFISEQADKPHHLLHLASEKSSQLIIVNRDGETAEKHIPILTNKNHIEVVCLY